jgi:hypothetical protein
MVVRVFFFALKKGEKSLFFYKMFIFSHFL